MRQRFVVSVFTLAAVAAMLSLSPAAAPQAYTPPKTASGQPDLQGIWQISNTSASYNVEPHTASWKVPAGIGAIVDPLNGMIPYLPAAAAKRQENFRNREKLDGVEKCYKPGVPRLMYMNFPFQILQTPQFVMIVSEYIHNTRTIYLNRKQHLEGVDFWNGDSIGRWEGNTLVTDVNHFNGQTWLDASGNHHSDALRVEERFTRADPDTLTYEVTITDPKTFSRPWKMNMFFYRHKERNFKILEYECHAYAEDGAAGK